MSRSMPVPVRRAVLTVMTVVLCAFTAVMPAASADPAAATGAAQQDTYTNLAYVAGGNGRQVLDLYLPQHVGRPVALVLYIHGGGWAGGDKSELQANSGWQTYLNQGFAVASINYTLSDTAKFPQQIYDVNAAIRFLRANAGKYRLNGKIGLWGGSAGGQLAALAGASCGVSSLQNKEGVTKGSSCVQAVVDGMGPTDFLEMDDHLYDSTSLKHDPANSAESRYLGCAQGLKACPASTVERANPITYLTTSSQVPPYFIVHGDADTLVPHWESEILFDALRSVCADATFTTVHGEGHMLFLTGALDPPYPAVTVQSSQGCAPVTTSDGPSLTWGAIGAFFGSHLR